MSKRKNADRVTQYGISAIRAAIEEWIHSEQDRRIMVMADIDHLTFAEIAAQEDVTERTVSRRVHKGENIIFRHM